MLKEEKRKELLAYIRFLEKSKFNVYKMFKYYNNDDTGLGPVRDQHGTLQHGDKEKAEVLQQQFQ